MKCQHCKQHDARVQVLARVNDKQYKMNLCHDCYRKVQGHMKSPQPFHPSSTNGFGQAGAFGGGQGSMNDFMNGFMPFGPGAGQDAAAHGATTQTSAGHGSGGLLDELGRNLTQSAKAGMIDPVIGREEEVSRVIESLNRRNKNNPVLIGEPGVGKTAIAEGLALKITEGNVPKKLKNKELYLLDVASLVANTGIRGQFEERMKQLITEIQERQNTIVFIDEIHLLVGAGKAEGSMDAGNILKPALARGELQVIGATTLNEYRAIEKDAALERRFQPVIVHEPTVEEAVYILKGLAPRYEQYHDVHYPEETVQACVTLSKRYIQDRFLPDKAIDLLDEAGSRLNLQRSEQQGETLEDQLEEVRRQKAEATRQEQYEQAAKLRDKEAELHEKLAAQHAASHAERTADINADGKKASEPAANTDDKASVTVEHIAEIVERKTGIPVQKLQADEQTNMRNLAEQLSSKVIGQEAAVQQVAKAIRRSRAGLKAKNRPVGSFLFVGPTGVGKTELSKRLAEELFGDAQAMIRLDMSEYMEKHAVSKIIGSPPGYVGHEEAGQLTEKVRRNPYSIVLLDEIEKAHPDVQHMFLQIMEDGRLTDSQGRTVSFQDTVIIMTSNAGTGETKKAIGFTGEDIAAREANIMEELGDYFKPEFLNRFDSIVKFDHLSEENMVHIVDIMLDDVQQNLHEQHITLDVSAAAKQKLAETGYDHTFGARPLRRTIQAHIEDRIADVLLDGDAIQHIAFDVDENGQFVVNTKTK